MPNTSLTRSHEREALLLRQKEQEWVSKTREQILLRHRWEAIVHERRRMAARTQEREEKVVVARCPTCGETLERIVFPMADRQSAHTT